MDPNKPIGVTSLPTDEMTTSAGGRYVFTCRVGAGGMGEVFRAEDTRLKRTVAIKRLPIQKRADERLRSRLQAEAERTSALNHPNIAVIHDIVEEKGELLIVMEYVEGVTLRERLQAPLPLDQFFPIAIQCAEALGAAHKKGIIHCDIKPENIMVAPSGPSKILDFGIARHLPGSSAATVTETSAHAVCGTPGYVAPEVILGEPPDARADIFSLGVVFFEMLTAHHPFLTGNPLGAVQRILHDDPPGISQPPLRYPAQLEKIIARMLARNAEKRYADADELARDLRAAQSDLVLAPAARRRTRRAIVSSVALTAVLAGALIAALYWLRPPQPGAPSVRQKHIAVLPFRAIGARPEDQAYGDGLTETLSAKLTQLTVAHQLQVAPPSEVRSSGVDTPDKARRELGVSYVIEGSLQRVGETVRVNYSLVDAATKRLVRSETITASAADPFALEDRVVEGALRLLVLEIREQDRESLGERGTRDARAYDEYLKGLGYLQTYDLRPENIDAALASFQRALQLDPDYANAYAAIGEAYWQRYRATKERNWMDSARQNCQRSLDLDPTLAAAHICLGNVLTQAGQYREAAAEFDLAAGYEPSSDAAYVGLARAYQRLDRPEDAERTYQKAIQVRPQYWGGHFWLGAFYYQRARYADAITHLRRATELAPDSARAWAGLGGAMVGNGDYEAAISALDRAISIRPTWIAYSNLGNANLYLRRYPEAVAALEQAVKLNPNQQVALGNLARAYYWHPDRRADAAATYRRAIAAAEQDLKVNPDDADAHVLLANYHAYLGEKRQSLDHLARALRSGDDPETLFQAGIAYTMLGDRRRALDALEQAARRGYSPAELRAAPEFDTLRSDPRFAALAGRVAVNK